LENILRNTLIALTLAFLAPAASAQVPADAGWKITAWSWSTGTL
jgi:hypothetical protein